MGDIYNIYIFIIKSHKIVATKPSFSLANKTEGKKSCNHDFDHVFCTHRIMRALADYAMNCAIT